MRFILNEGNHYLDDEEQFYDYHTQEVVGNELFDTSKTGMSYYDNFLNDLSYMQRVKNRTGEIVMMSPLGYFQGCAEIFNSSVDKQIKQTMADNNTIEQLKQVILKYHRRFPLTFLNYADNTQGGRHRMYVAGELASWDTKFPVLVVNIYDYERDKQEQIDQIIYILNSAIQEIKLYHYNDIEEAKEQLIGELEKRIDEFNIDLFKFIPDDDECVIEYDGAKTGFSLSELDIG